MFMEVKSIFVFLDLFLFNLFILSFKRNNPKHEFPKNVLYLKITILIVEKKWYGYSFVGYGEDGSRDSNCFMSFSGIISR